MAERPDREFNIRLAQIQIVASILASIGAVLVSVGFGFSLTVYPALQQIVDQGQFNIEVIRMLEEHTGVTSDYAPSPNSFVIYGGLTNYSGLLIILGLIFIAAAIIGSRISLNNARRLP